MKTFFCHKISLRLSAIAMVALLSGCVMDSQYGSQQMGGLAGGLAGGIAGGALTHSGLGMAVGMLAGSAIGQSLSYQSWNARMNQKQLEEQTQLALMRNQQIQYIDTQTNQKVICIPEGDIEIVRIKNRPMRRKSLYFVTTVNNKPSTIRAYAYQPYESAIMNEHSKNNWITVIQ